MNIKKNDLSKNECHFVHRVCKKMNYTFVTLYECVIHDTWCMNMAVQCFKMDTFIKNLYHLFTMCVNDDKKSHFLVNYALIPIRMSLFLRQAGS